MSRAFIGVWQILDMGIEPSVTVCHVLREDSQLAAMIPAERRDRAVDACIAPVLRLHHGHWSGELDKSASDGIGLLVLGGLLLRRVSVEGHFGAELLGDGDLLRPWQGENNQLPTLPWTTGWRVLKPTRLALLDIRVAGRFAQYPELTGQLVARALERSRNLSVNMAIVHQARVDTRLHMLLWHLADRWGQVRPDGLLLPLRLTHAVLADLVAARRPTVTSALSELAEANLVHPLKRGWLLPGGPPNELLQLHSLTRFGTSNGAARHARSG